MQPAFKTEHPFTSGEDISSVGFWRQSFAERDETFARLRKNDPVSWHPPLEMPELGPEIHGQSGFWALVRAKDIRYVSLHHELFSSVEPVFRPRHPDILQLPPTFLSMDPPAHTRYRQIMSRAFTPKAVSALDEKIKERAKHIVDRVAGGGEFDFVNEVSAKLPMMTVADMVGVPESLVETFATAGNNHLGARDPQNVPPGMTADQFSMQQILTLKEIGVDLVRHRRSHPSHDIATALANAELDGRALTDDEIGQVMLLLSVAGNDTTKQTTSQTVVSLYRNRDQMAWLNDDFDARIGGAIDEFVRHASPVIVFARVARQDIELGGSQIAAGDKVAMFYASGNRDESEFDDPHRFDLSRPKKPHVAFGGGGVHYCLGNGIAKTQLRALFGEILCRLPNMEVGEPEYLYSEFIHGITHLPVKVD